MRFTNRTVLDRPLHNIGPVTKWLSHSSGRRGIGVGGNHLNRITSETERTHDHGMETCMPPSTISSGVSTTNKWVQTLALSFKTTSWTTPNILASGRTTGRPCRVVNLRSGMMPRLELSASS